MITLAVTIIVHNVKVSKQINAIKNTTIREIIEFGKYALDAHKYGDTDTIDMYWQNISIRDWLNDEIYNETFSNSEKKLIIDATVAYLLDSNDQYGKVFLQSEEEAK